MVAFLQLKALIFEIFEGVAAEHMQRGVEAEHFFGARRWVGEKVTGVRMAQEGLDAIAERVDGGFMAGVEKKDGGGDEFVAGERRAVRVVRGEELGEKVVLRMTAPLGEVGAHVFAERDGGGDSAVLHGAVAAGLIHGDHVVGPSEDLRGYVRRNAEEAGDDHDRHRFSEGFDKVGGAVGGKLVDEFVGECFDLRTQTLDLARQERGVDECAQPGMDRWFEFEKRVLFKLAKRREAGGWFRPAEFFAGGEVEDLTSEAAIPEERADVVMAGEAPQIKLLPAKGWKPGAPLRVERVGILHEIRVARAQGNAAFHGSEVVSVVSAAQCGLIERLVLLVHAFGVRILFFAQLREIAGTEAAEIDADGIDSAGLWALLEMRWPGLAAHRFATRLARNGSYAEPAEIFASRDEVALIPPVSGG